MTQPSEWRKGRKATAVYVKKSICCGDSVLYKDIPLGRTYTVYPDSVGPGDYCCGACGKCFPVPIILTENSDGTDGWLPLGIFEIGQAA